MSLDTARFSLYEHQNQTHVATAESGTSLKDVLEPNYFSNVANKLQPYDRIHVRVDTGEWYAELLVTSCGKNWAKTLVMYEVEFKENINEDETQNEAFSKFLVKHNGPHQKWCVIRKSDNEPIKVQCASRQEASAWLASYLNTLS